MADKLLYPDMFKVANWKTVEKFIGISNTGLSQKFRDLEVAHTGLAGALVLAGSGTDMATKNLRQTLSEAANTAVSTNAIVHKLSQKYPKKPLITTSLGTYDTHLKTYHGLLLKLHAAEIKPTTVTKVNAEMKKLIWRPT